MDRATAMWTLVLFFGCSIVFNVILRATDDSSAGVRYGLQAVVLAVIVGAVVLVARRRR